MTESLQFYPLRGSRINIWAKLTAEKEMKIQ